MSALQSWVDEAVAWAMLSPCQSKRGVVISSQDGMILSAGWNNQPSPFRCDGSDDCKKNCGKTAIHAEQMAILSLSGPRLESWLLHVKAREHKPCASGMPSCLECSKLILAAGIAWVHLLHDPTSQVLPGATVVGETDGWLRDGVVGKLSIRRYHAIHFHYLTAEYYHRIPLMIEAKNQCD